LCCPLEVPSHAAAAPAAQTAAAVALAATRRAIVVAAAAAALVVADAAVLVVAGDAAFVPAIAVATLRQPPLPELAALQAATLALSLAYHRNYERPGRLSKLEGSTAKTLFAYGAAQTYLSPTPECLAVSAGSLRQAAELVDRLLQRGPAPRRAGLVRIRGQDTDDRDRR